jgi:hypothetical protein
LVALGVADGRGLSDEGLEIAGRPISPPQASQVSLPVPMQRRQGSM